jgi:hypothetical protein
MTSAVKEGSVMATSKVTTMDPGTIEMTEIDEGGIFIAAAVRISRPLTNDE